MLVAQQYITVRESSSLAARGNALPSLEQVHRPPPWRDDTDDLTLEGEQMAPLGSNEFRGTRGKFYLATEQFFEIIRGQCERLKLRDPATCLQGRLHVVQAISLRGDRGGIKRTDDRYTHPSHVETSVSRAPGLFNANANSDVVSQKERNFRLFGKRGTG